jgi:hypothetical protein
VSVQQLAYTIYSNVDAGYVRPYERGDRLVRGYSGTIDVDLTEQVTGVAERLFVRHNGDDRPDALLCPSMSVGDVVVVGEVALSVAGCGFEQVVVDGEDVIIDRSWREVIVEPTRRASDSARRSVSWWRSPPSSALGISLEGLDR